MVSFIRLVCCGHDSNNDRSSLAHGTPPNINRSNWDVTVPSISTVVSNEGSERHVQSLNSFIHLCSLTRILEEMLPIVYDLQPIEDATWKIIRKLEHSLDVWRDGLPMYLKQVPRECLPHVNGASNLWFCYLSVKLLLCRLSLKVRTLHMLSSGWNTNLQFVDDFAQSNISASRG